MASARRTPRAPQPAGLNVIARLAIALVVALVIAGIAFRAGSLSISGGVAAIVIGALALLAGWNWGALLIVYFISSSALSRLGGPTKAVRLASVIEKGGKRDALQVLANGAVFAVSSALFLADPPHAPMWSALGAGALAASASDTWATEIGALIGGAPRSILNFARLDTGMSGGVSFAGTLAAFAGAAFIALLVTAMEWPPRVAFAAFLGGLAGSTLDSVLGATLQERWWCERCRRETERVVHDCGTATQRTRGMTGLTNDAVNLACTLCGGLLALVIAR